jgi:hypothetical protein
MSWAALRGLQPTPIDLERTALIREADTDALSNPQWLESLLLRLGLNDEALNEWPTELHAHCGHGLRIWQYPTQFSKYLTQLSRLQIRSYLEIGIRHGGSFVTTAEYLQRFHPLAFAVGVDVIACPSMAAYQSHNLRAQFWFMNSLGPDFAARLDQLDPLDLAFIDSHHEEHQCRREFELLADRANLIAFHDIANIGCPGVRQVWQEVKRLPGYECLEYVDQYGLGPFMGIGLAVKKERLRRVGMT